MQQKQLDNITRVTLLYDNIAGWYQDNRVVGEFNRCEVIWIKFIKRDSKDSPVSQKSS